MILVDTSVWIDFLRGTASPEHRSLADAFHRGEELCICGLILAETLQGTSDDDVAAVRRRLRSLTYLPMGRNSYVMAANLYRRARRRGRTIRSTIDCLIAACAIRHDVPLLQKDRDFQAIAAVSGLRLVPC